MPIEAGILAQYALRSDAMELVGQQSFEFRTWAVLRKEKSLARKVLPVNRAAIPERVLLRQRGDYSRTPERQRRSSQVG